MTESHEFRLAYPDKLYIGGEWRTPSSDCRIEIVHPGLRDIRFSIAEARETDVDAAIAAAREAFDTGPWPLMSVADRAACLEKWAAALDSRLEDLVLAHTTEIGLPISATRMMAQAGAANLRAAIEQAKNYAFVEERPARGGTAMILREPVGVVAAIVPWNFPIALGMVKIAPALLSGCTIVVKPSPEAPLDLLIVAECAEAAGLPKGVLSIIPADRDVGDRLIRDPRIDKVSFTGSTAAGKHIGAVCMDRVARVSLELGGKSAAILLDDAPLESAVPSLVAMSTMLNGQACMALTRVLVSKERAGELTEALGAAYSALSIGDPFDPAIRIGPLASPIQRDRVEAHIARGKAEGARVVTGGDRPAELDRGYFVQPTIFGSVTNDMTIAQQEIFGPVLSVIAYDDVDHAVAIANDSLYGLNSAVFTQDQDRMLHLARRIRAGTVAQNAMGPQAHMPFGGYKQSGFGREGSIESFDLYTELKTVYVQKVA